MWILEYCQYTGLGQTRQFRKKFGGSREEIELALKEAVLFLQKLHYLNLNEPHDFYFFWEEIFAEEKESKHEMITKLEELLLKQNHT